MILEESYWNRDGCCDFKQIVLTLLNSISGYVDYLNSTPVREIGKNLCIKLLSPCSVLGDSLFEKSIEIELEKAQNILLLHSMYQCNPLRVIEVYMHFNYNFILVQVSTTGADALVDIHATSIAT